MIAKRSASTESVFEVSLAEAGSSGPGVSDTTSVAATAAVELMFEVGLLGLRSAAPCHTVKPDHLGAETVARSAQPLLLQMHSKAPRHRPATGPAQRLLVKLGLLESRSRVPRRNLNPQRVPVKLGLLGAEQMT